MSIYPNVMEQDLINLLKLAEQQKKHRAPKIKDRISKQTHYLKLAQSFSPITKKLEEVNGSTKKSGKVGKESSSENENYQKVVPVEIESEDETFQTSISNLPNSKNFSTVMTETLGALMNSRISLKLIQIDSGRASILGVPFYTLGGNRIKMNDSVYDLTPEIYKVLSSTSYAGKTMKNENDILMMNNIIEDLGYTGIGDKP